MVFCQKNLQTLGNTVLSGNMDRWVRKLELLMKVFDWSSAKLAQRADIDKRKIQRWIGNKVVSIKLSDAIRIARVFNVSLDDLFLDERELDLDRIAAPAKPNVAVDVHASLKRGTQGRGGGRSAPMARKGGKKKAR